jgi:hypothetical protein
MQSPVYSKTLPPKIFLAKGLAGTRKDKKVFNPIGGNSMNKDTQAELVAVFQQLGWIERAEVLQFAQIQLEALKADKKANKELFTAQNWDRLTYWQKKALLWRVRWYVFTTALLYPKKA